MFTSHTTYLSYIPTIFWESIHQHIVSSKSNVIKDSWAKFIRLPHPKLGIYYQQCSKLVTFAKECIMYRVCNALVNQKWICTRTFSSGYHFLHFSLFFFLLHTYRERLYLIVKAVIRLSDPAAFSKSLLFRPFQYGRPCMYGVHLLWYFLHFFPFFSCFYRPRATLFDCKGRDTSVRSRGHGPGFAQEDLFQCLQASFNHRQNPTEDGTHFKPDIPWSCLWNRLKYS